MTKKLKLSKNTSIQKFGGGGAHWHELSPNPEMTQLDGGHKHLFVIGGIPVWTMYDGDHSHPVSLIASRTGLENQKHKHTLKLDGIARTTSEGNSHIHELTDNDNSTNMSGIHRHLFVMEDGEEIQSILPGDLLQSEIRKRVALEIQSVHVSNLLFTDEQAAIQFIEDRGFIGRDLQKLEDGFKFRQLSRDRFKDETLKELELTNGVKAIVGVLDPDKMVEANQTLDSLKDVNPAEEIMREEQVAALTRLKDSYAMMIVDMKEKATRFIPILNQFVDLSDEFLKNEPFQVFLTEFIDSFDVLQSEMTRIDMDEHQEKYKTKSKKIYNFEDNIRDIEPILKNLSETFYDSEAFDNFGRLLKKNHLLFKQMILNLPLIRAEGIGTSIEKSYNNYIDFEIMSAEELEHLSLKDISALRVKEMDLSKLRDSESLNATLTELLKKLTTDEETVTIEFGSNFLDESIVIDKQSGQSVDLCYNLDRGIPLPTNSVHHILAKEFLQHVSDRVMIMGEISRVMKDGATINIETPSTDGRQAFSPCFKSLWNVEVFKYFTEGDDAAFEIVENSTKLEEDGSSATVIVKMIRKPRS